MGQLQLSWQCCLVLIVLGLAEAAMTRTDHHLQKAGGDTYAYNPQYYSRTYYDRQGNPVCASEALEQRFQSVFGPVDEQGKRSSSRKRRRMLIGWTRKRPWYPSSSIPAQRLLNNDDAANAKNDDYYSSNNDDAYKTDDAANNNDDGNNNNKKWVSVADERCSEFLVSFLEGTTDAHDTCEGMMNAYTAAGKQNASFMQIFILMFIMDYPIHN